VRGVGDAGPAQEEAQTVNGNGKAILSAVGGAVVGALLTAGAAGVTYGGRLARLEANVQTMTDRQNRIETKLDTVLLEDRSRLTPAPSPR
jgi:hypothetical protein